MRNGSPNPLLSGALLPCALGLCALSLMMVPQLALNTGYNLIVRGALCGLLCFTLVRRSVRGGIWFVLIMGAAAWLLDVDEGAMIALYTATGLAMALIVGHGAEPVYVRIAIGCVAAALILAGGTAGLILWRKEGELFKALQYGALSEWTTLVAALVGGLGGGYIAKRSGAAR